MQPQSSDLNSAGDPVYRALVQALTQARTSSAAESAPFMSQWLLALRYALPHQAYWEEARALLLIVLDFLSISGRLADTLTWLRDGIEYSERYGDARTAATLKIELGREQIRQGNISEAQAILNDGIAYFQRERIVYAPALNALSYLALSRGETREAEALAQQALDTLPRDASAWLELGQSYRNLGTAAQWRQEPEAALPLFEESARWWNIGNSPRYYAFGLVNIASALRQLERYAEAEHYYREAIAIFEEVNDPINRTYAQMNLGNIFLRQEMWDAAIEQYYAAEQILAQSQMRFVLGRLYPNWALAYLGMQDYEAAYHVAERVVEILTELDDRLQRANSLDILGLALQGLGRFKEAQSAFLRGLEDLDSLSGDHKLSEEIREHLAALDIEMKSSRR